MKNKKKIIGSIVILSIFVLFLTVGYIISKPAKVIDSKDVFNETTAIDNKSIKELTVYINGEVRKPGVYKLKDGGRIEDLVRVAGGFTESANQYKLNLAKKLKDEDYIYVDKIVDEKGNAVGSTSGNSMQNGKININSASKEELKTIPGIGDITSQKIIEYREKNGGFSSIEDLKKIDRIGDKTLDKIRDKIDAR